MNFFKEYLVWVIIAAILILIVLFALVFGVCYAIQVKRKETERLNQMWRIPFIALESTSKKVRSIKFRERCNPSRDVFPERRAQPSIFAKW
ncbi:hypothetical protein COOONC_27497 [Cooperia oncophora]